MVYYLEKRFGALMQHNLATTRRHENIKTLPHNTLTYPETGNAIKFNGDILLPVCIPEYKRDNLQFLPLRCDGCGQAPIIASGYLGRG